MMKTNKDGIRLIEQLEGCRLKSYKLKGEKYYTIGYGHSYDSSIKTWTVWSRKKAESMLAKDLRKFEAYVNKTACKKFKLNNNQFSALVSYCYNRGPGGLKQLVDNSSSTYMLGKNMVKYWGTSQTYKSALISRRIKESKLFFTFTVSKVIGKHSKKENIIWMQRKLNSINTGIAKLVVDGCWGSKTRNYVVSVWKKWGWKPSSGWCIGKKTIAKLKKM